MGRDKRSRLNNGDIILNGRYEVLKCIHSKGMANVYIIQDTNLGKQWCLKEIRKSEAGRNDIEYVSLLQEANILRSLNHERIPRITSIDDEGDSLYVVMDFLDGKNLKDFVTEKGKIPEDMAVKWMLQITQTMAYLHTEKGNKKPIFYRDMKPDNLMIRPNGNINIFDFGISLRVESKDQLPGYTLGTAGYVAPEQKKKTIPVDLRSDIYAMGRTFYFMLTGVDPRSFLNKELKPIKFWSPEVSNALVSVVEKCMQEDPNDRYQSCEELQYALENYKLLDEKHKSYAKTRIKIVLAMLLSGVILGVGSIVPFSMNSVQTEKSYKDALLVAEQSGKFEDYEKVISMKPTDLTNYDGFLESIKVDGVFSKSEETVLLSYINPNLEEIKDSSEYGRIAYELGKLYWFYYDTDDSDSGEILSIKWFEDAMKKNYNKKESETYYNLGMFKKNISKSIKEASDTGMYKNYWNNLLSIQDEGSSDIVTLQTNISIARCISVYCYNLKNDGISYKEVNKEVDYLNNFIKGYNVDKSSLGVIKELYNELQNILKELPTKVNIVYGGV